MCLSSYSRLCSVKRFAARSCMPGSVTLSPGLATKMWRRTPDPPAGCQKGLAIFSAPRLQPMARLTQLDEQPVHAASRYVYDWLVALYTRANENKGYQHSAGCVRRRQKTADGAAQCLMALCNIVSRIRRSRRHPAIFISSKQRK